MRIREAIAIHCSRRLFGHAAVAALAIGFVTARVYGQQDASATPGQNDRGLQVTSVSIYSVYYSNTTPVSGLLAPPLGLGDDVGFGGSARVSLMHRGERSSFSLVYSPSYNGRARYSAWDSLNHSLLLTGMRRFGRWTFHPSASAMVSNYEGFLFSPTTFSNLAATPGSSADLSTAILGRNVQDPQLNAALNSGSVSDAPAGVLLYGERLLSANAKASFSYSASSRFSIVFTGEAGRNQSLPQQGLTSGAHLIAKTTSFNGSTGISYALAPRTQVTAKVTSSRVATDIIDAYHTKSTGSIARTLYTHWVLTAYGGVELVKPVREIVAATPSGPHPVEGVSFGYRSHTQTLLGSFDRAVSDPFGTGAITSSNASVSWHWERPGAGWMLNGNVSWQQLDYTSRDVSAWRTSFGWGRTLSRRLVFMAEYAYMTYSGQVRGLPYVNSQSALRCSLIWRPPSVFAQ